MDFISVLLSRLSPLSALVPTVVRVDIRHLIPERDRPGAEIFLKGNTPLVHHDGQ